MSGGRLFARARRHHHLGPELRGDEAWHEWRMMRHLCGHILRDISVSAEAEESRDAQSLFYTQPSRMGSLALRLCRQDHSGQQILSSGDVPGDCIREAVIVDRTGSRKVVLANTAR